jgi:hypothetical protein
MRPFLKFLLIAILAINCSASAFAAETRDVSANKTTAILFYYTSASDTCYSGGKPKVSFTRKPAHGSVTTEWKAYKMGKEAGNCAGKPMRGTVVYYKPTPGYRGPDKVSVIFRGGISGGYFEREREYIIKINVK